MHSKIPPGIALLASLIGLLAAGPAEAQDGARYHGARPAYPHGPVRRHARALPPDVAYRDPRIDLRPRGRPDFLIHAYMPRFTDVPMYNEPPAHFPQR